MVKNLKLLREERGLSQQKLAEMLNTTQQSIFKYERTKSEPDIATLIQLADIFEVSVDYLIGNSDVREKYVRQEAMLLSEQEVSHIHLWRSIPKDIQSDTDQLLSNIKKIKKA